MNITGLWDQLVDCICRPPRDEYAVADLPGGVGASFKLKGKEYLRKDAQLVNKQGLKLKCSHLVPKYPPQTKDGRLPCVVYCHCNSGSRRDSEEALHLLLPQNITVFALDFAVVDSPFSRLTELMMELVEEQKIPIPRSLMRVALSMMRRSVKKRAGFSIDEVAPIEQVQKAFIPCLFGHARDDTFVAKGHSERLLAKYGGEDKELCLFEGDHNSIRPTFFYTKALMFFHVVLQCESVLIPDETSPGQFELAANESARSVNELEPLQLPLRTLPRTHSPVWTDLPTFDGSPEDMQDYLSNPQLTRGNSLPEPRETARRTPEPRRETADARQQQPRRQEATPQQTLTEEAALARALELSLREVQQQEHGHIPGGGRQAAAAASTALQETIPEDMQHMAPEDAEEAMLAAAIRASLIEADEQHASSSAQDDTAPSSMTQPHASSSAQDNKPMTTGQHETRSPVSDSRRHDRSEQQQPSSSRQAAETQQRNSESSPLPDGERTHQSSSSSSSQKPPRQSFRNSHSAAALYSLDHEPNAATGSGQQSSRNGYSSSLSQQQQAQRDQLASDLRKISLQAGSAQAVGSSKQPAQRMHLLHQTHTQPAADVGHGSSTASQVMRQQYLGRGQNEHHGDQQQSPVQQDRGSVKQQHSPRSALQPSGSSLPPHTDQQGIAEQQQANSIPVPQQAQQAENALSPHAAQTSTSEDGSTTADVDATAADIRSKGLMSAAAVSEEAGIASTGDPQQQDQAKAAGSDVTQTYPDTQLYQFADIELAQH